MRKPAFCICENKDADQLRGDREADQRLCFRYINYSKKVSHHLIFTKFLSNFLIKYTKHFFLKIKYCCRGLDTLSDTTINLRRNILLKSVKMHFSGNTEIFFFLKVHQFVYGVQNSFNFKNWYS